MKRDILLGIKIKSKTENNSLEKILLYLDKKEGFKHIVSINPENVVIAQVSSKFREILSQGDIQLIDGIGVLLGCSILGIQAQPREAGIDFMKDVLKLSKNRSLRVLFLGGRTDLADKIANRYQKIYPRSKFKGIFGISDIHNPTEQEEACIFSIVADYKPQILFVAFGSPYQELWIDTNKSKLEGVITMGVGGSFDFISGSISRAPQFLRSLGLEWLFRLIIEPWRWRRQLRLIQFLILIFKQRFGILKYE